MINARPSLQQVLKKMSPANRRESLQGLNALVNDPYGPEADHFVEETVRRYNLRAINSMIREDVILIPKAWNWYRALQVRFVQIGCADRSSIEAAIRKELSGDPLPSIDRLMREVFRQNVLDTLAYGKANKDLPPSLRAPRLNGAEVFWEQAFTSLNRDMGSEVKKGKTMDDAPMEWFLILGKDYCPEAMSV